MQLDFRAIRGDPTEKPLESPRTAFNGLDSIEVSGDAKTAQKAPERATEGTERAGRLLAQYKQEQAEHERTLAIYRGYQHNIKESGGLRADILKGTKAGEPPVALLLKAVKCISLMTGDTVFYSQLEGDIKCIYGAGLLEPEPLELELQETQERLQRLQQAIQRDTEPADSKQRIERAIQAHKERISQLQGLIRK